MQQKTDAICKIKHLYSLPYFASHRIIPEAHICDAVLLIYRNQEQKPGFQGALGLSLLMWDVLPSCNNCSELCSELCGVHQGTLETLMDNKN